MSNTHKWNLRMTKTFLDGFAIYLSRRTDKRHRCKALRLKTSYLLCRKTTTFLPIKSDHHKPFSFFFNKQAGYSVFQEAERWVAVFAHFKMAMKPKKESSQWKHGNKSTFVHSICLYPDCCCRGRIDILLAKMPDRQHVLPKSLVYMLLIIQRLKGKKGQCSFQDKNSHFYCSHQDHLKTFHRCKLWY